jgi:hypothetical protein
VSIAWNFICLIKVAGGFSDLRAVFSFSEHKLHTASVRARARDYISCAELI